ncbi:sirohydrochlorin chelatase [Phytohabitans kaempferiae]|uniref:Sirohydrochlorin chelatase n=1 Tax=Phytohabitans kaempferiae TaxID=1620943 RepID=A0ABV6M407_9ACTN
MRPAHMTPLLLVAHGSRDPRAARATRALVRAVAAARPGLDVRAAYLDHTLPRPGQVLSALEAAGHERVTLVPLLLTAAYHGRVDVPEVVRTARAAGLRLPVAVAPVLGPVTGAPVDEALLAGLRRRLAAAGSGFDGVVLAAAGTRDATARQTVVRAADALGESLGVPARVAYASAAAPTGAEAVAQLRASGAERIGVAAYFLAPGLLYDAVIGSALEAGAMAAAQPLEGAAELARLVLARADEVSSSLAAVAA